MRNVKEAGRYQNEVYALYESGNNNLILVAKEGAEPDSADLMSDVFGYLTEERGTKLVAALNGKENIAAYVYQAEGTSSDVLLFDRNGCNTASDLYRVIETFVLDQKYMDKTA